MLLGVALHLMLRMTPGASGAEPPSTNHDARPDRDGVLVHMVQSSHQAEPTKIRVLLPSSRPAGERFPVIYVLPVEAAEESRYGDGLQELRRLGLADRHRVIFVAPTFAHLPWYANHPTDRTIGQERYLLEDVVPLVDRLYPAAPGAKSRLLLGFSKSGWGAFSLLLRHPDVFGKAAAWDAPLMMNRPGLYGSGPIFGDAQNFEKYRLTHLIRDRGRNLGEGVRLIHLGRGNFQAEHIAFEAELNRLGIPHRYIDGPAREHRWGSGWIPNAVDALLEPDAGSQDP